MILVGSIVLPHLVEILVECVFVYGSLPDVEDLQGLPVMGLAGACYGDSLAVEYLFAICDYRSMPAHMPSICRPVS